ncbi:hypothetical protein [Edaphobacter modestus]|uniref:hypothetical protein n=1 Tax=Edaphobacter modestus TaxID=388466 RepID=UPI00102AFB38|nr:hypothetical protein [Edaphobacter modestus]
MRSKNSRGATCAGPSISLTLRSGLNVSDVGTAPASEWTGELCLSCLLRSGADSQSRARIVRAGPAGNARTIRASGRKPADPLAWPIRRSAITAAHRKK